MKKKLSLSERIALAASGAQEDEYPEDTEYETSARVVDVDSDDEDRPEPRPRRSLLRTKNVELLDELDERYVGTKTSRKKLVDEGGLNGFNGLSSSVSSQDVEESDEGSEIEDDEDSGSEEEDSDDHEGVKKSGKLETDEESEGLDDDDMMSGSGEEEEDSEDDDESDIEDDDDEADASAGMQTLSVRDKQLEIEKGRATLNQLRIWDSLLEVRIRLQKMLLDCNRLPSGENFQSVITYSEDGAMNLTEVLQNSQKAVKVLVHELQRLQGILVEKNSETKKGLESKPESSSTSSDGNGMDEEITSEEDDEEEKNIASSSVTPANRKRKVPISELLENAKKSKPEDFLACSQKSFTQFKPYRNQIIQKWNDKTQFAGGKYNRKSAVHHISTLKQIEQILSNKDRLLKRTQIKRSKYSVIGSTTTPEVEENTEGNEQQQHFDPEIFDDDDFYHQLLRELIERKTANVNDPIQLSHHWLELQKLRTKLKKKVDTKASKGRKIRYDVHSKLVNFMAPQNNCTMSASAMKELFSSLFGKTKAD